MFRPNSIQWLRYGSGFILGIFFGFYFYLSKFSGNNLRCSQSQITDLAHLILWVKSIQNMLIAGHIWQVVARPPKRMVLETAVISLSQNGIFFHQAWNTESLLKSGRKLKPEQLESPLERGRSQWIIQNTSVKGKRNNWFGALDEFLNM